MNTSPGDPLKPDDAAVSKLRIWFSRLVPDYNLNRCTQKNNRAQQTSDARIDPKEEAERVEKSSPSQLLNSSAWKDTFSDWLRSDVLGINAPLQSISKSAMACEFEILLNERQYPLGVEVAFQCLELVEQIEDLLSVYRAGSEFAKINQLGLERSVYVAPMTLELLQLAVDAHSWTLGCFDITAGTLSETWGFSRRQGSMPTQAQIEAALHAVGTQHLQLELENRSVRLLRAGLKLNPGGIGKGFALDRCSQILLEGGIQDFMMHGGLSSITARGSRRGVDSDWTVALKHPFRSEELIEHIPLRNQSLGTSGSGKQFFHFGGKRYSHIIDPRTGWPAEQMMSVTVICPSCAIADALATGLFVMGVEAANEFCERFSDIAAVLIYQDAKSGSQRIEHRNWHLVE